MSKLKHEYEKQDDVPEAVRDFYEERGGKWLLTQVEGMVTQADVDRVMRAKTQEAEAHAATKKALGDILGDHKPEEITAMLQEYPELKAAASKDIPDDEKLETIVANRTKAQLLPIQRERDTLTKERDELKEKVQAYQLADVRRALREEVRKRCVGEVGSIPKLRETAVQDALDRAEREFKIDESGEVTTADGKTIELWLTERQESHPHWWPESRGGGAPGGKTGIPSVPDNPFSAEHWNLTNQGQLIKTLGLEKAQQLAKLAGTTVGGQKPEPKKAA